LILQAGALTEQDEILLALIEQETWVKIRLQEEGQSMEGDLVLVRHLGEALDFWEEKELQPFQEEEDFALWRHRSLVLVYHRLRANPHQLTNYKNLSRPEFQDALLVSRSNPDLPGLISRYAYLEGEDAALQWARGFFQNLFLLPLSSDEQVLNELALGQGVFGLVDQGAWEQYRENNPEEDLLVLKVLEPSEEPYEDWALLLLSQESSNKKAASRVLSFLRELNGGLNLEGTKVMELHNGLRAHRDQGKEVLEKLGFFSW